MDQDIHVFKSAVVVVQSLSHVQLFLTPWTAAPQASLSFTISQSLLKLTSIVSAMPSNQSRPLSSPSPPAFNLSQHQCLFQWVSSSHQLAKVLELQLQHQPFQWIFRVGFPLRLTGLIFNYFVTKLKTKVSPNYPAPHSHTQITAS